MTDEQLKARLKEENSNVDIPILPGLSSTFVGILYDNGSFRACYDLNESMKLMKKMNLKFLDALQYFELDKEINNKPKNAPCMIKMLK